jgi:hypothetical protein
MFRTINSLPRILDTIIANKRPRSLLPRRMINLIQDAINTLLDSSGCLAQPVRMRTGIAHVGLYPATPPLSQLSFLPQNKANRTAYPG